jgi:hypothetical protein
MRFKSFKITNLVPLRKDTIGQTQPPQDGNHSLTRCIPSPHATIPRANQAWTKIMHRTVLAASCAGILSGCIAGQSPHDIEWSPDAQQYCTTAACTEAFSEAATRNAATANNIAALNAGIQSGGASGGR